MTNESSEISSKGKVVKVATVTVDNRPVVIAGKWMKVATIQDDEWWEGELLDNVDAFTAKLKTAKIRADVFTFPQKATQTQPRYSYPMELDNVAVVPITTFKDWWEKRLPQESRKNVRRAEKRGITVRTAEFNDELVKGIQQIYNETPIRQGKRFWHYGKDFETVKRENATFLERSEFICAYLNDELVGFIKMVYVDDVASLMQILAREEHHDKRPMNALLAKAVEICEQKQISHFIYGKYTYGNKNQSSLGEFKRRNGFEQINFPKYYVPLNLKGEIYIRLKLYRGAGALLPEPILRAALAARAWYVRLFAGKKSGATTEESAGA